MLQALRTRTQTTSRGSRGKCMVAQSQTPKEGRIPHLRTRRWYVPANYLDPLGHGRAKCSQPHPSGLVGIALFPGFNVRGNQNYCTHLDKVL